MSVSHSRDSAQSLVLDRSELAGRTFILGNAGGFVLYLPVENNHGDQSAFPGKWFGASGFGRKFLEVNLVWLCLPDGRAIELDRRDQVRFDQGLIEATRTFQIEGHTVTQTFLVPNARDAVVMTLDADPPAAFIVEAEYDMRYYQAFNTNFSHYRSEIVASDGRPRLRVFNHVDLP